MIRDNYLDVSKLIKNKKILNLFKVIGRHGGVVRFVGGAVRDALKGIEGSDLDFATDLSPDELVEACNDEGIKTVAIGIKYGTVGVVIDNTVLEVTSLRKDIKTDGRHAVVEFTDNWEEDASRRDLTINAVYADENGNVFDYYNGIEDLEKGIVRFIGNPDTRIKEDYLRILRFFRFYSLFGIGNPDKKALSVCAKNNELLKKLPMERIREELSKLLLTPNAAKTIDIMQKNNILSYVMPDGNYMDNLDFLKKLLKGKQLKNKSLLYLFTLYQPNESLADNLASRLKFSKIEKQKFLRWATNLVELDELKNDIKLKHLAYKFDKEFCLENLLLIVAKNKENLADFWDIYKKIENLEKPVFPIKGKDLIAEGICDGTQIGKRLKKLEEEWINSDFCLSKEDLLTPKYNKVSGE